MIKKPKRTAPFETEQLRQSLSSFFNTPYDDPITNEKKNIGSYKWGVYIFYDYDGEPIYVGQTKERVSGRIGRHLTNQRTDAVAMSVLDPFEVYEIEVYPLPQFENITKKSQDYETARATLNALEHWVHQKAIKDSKFKAILNEKDPPEPTVTIKPPLPLRQHIVSDKIDDLRRHSDVRIARRAQIISRLAQTISEREVKVGLRRTLVTQAERLRWLASDRFQELGGEAKVPKGPEDEEEDKRDR
jgi:GIY-YIG catalytic domain